jgi:hypothetical protein
VSWGISFLLTWWEGGGGDPGTLAIPGRGHVRARLSTFLAATPSRPFTTPPLAGVVYPLAHDGPTRTLPPSERWVYRSMLLRWQLRRVHLCTPPHCACRIRAAGGGLCPLPSAQPPSRLPARSSPQPAEVVCHWRISAVSGVLVSCGRISQVVFLLSSSYCERQRGECKQGNNSDPPRQPSASPSVHGVRPPTSLRVGQGYPLRSSSHIRG